MEGAVDGKQSDVVTQQAAKLQPEFTAAEQIFGAVKRSAAGRLAQAARSHAASIERAITAGDWAAASEAVRALSQQCQSCHSSQRQGRRMGPTASKCRDPVEVRLFPNSRRPGIVKGAQIQIWFI